MTSPTLFDAIPSAPIDARTRSLLDLIDGDPIHATDRATVVDTIRQVADANGGHVDQNVVRRLLRDEKTGLCRVYPNVIGAVVYALRKRGALVPVGWDVTKGSWTGNDGRPTRRYRLIESP